MKVVKQLKVSADKNPPGTMGL